MALVHADWNTFWESNKDQYLIQQVEKEANELEQIIAIKDSKKPGAASYMRRWGIGLIIAGSIPIIAFFLGANFYSPEEKEDMKPAIPGSIIYVIGGIWLTTKGQKNR